MKPKEKKVRRQRRTRCGWFSRQVLARIPSIEEAQHDKSMLMYCIATFSAALHVMDDEHCILITMKVQHLLPSFCPSTPRSRGIDVSASSVDLERSNRSILTDTQHSMTLLITSNTDWYYQHA